MQKIIKLYILLVFYGINAQVGVGTVTPNAALEISAATDGLLIPRVALSAKNVSTIITPSVSELIYNTATAGIAPNSVQPGFYFWNGTYWAELENSLGTKDWTTSGNSGTNASTEFLGTVDDVDLNFRRFNIKSGTIGISNSSYGLNSLSINITGNANSAFGKNALQNNAGSDNIDNTAFGFETLLTNNATITAFAKNNTAVGARALRNNTTGYNNSGIGLNSLTNTTSGYFNTGFGTGTLFTNVIGESNVAIGTGALRTNTSSFNCSIGRGSLFANTTGTQNTATGMNSISNNTLGSDNVGIGFITLRANISGNQNTGIGSYALNNSLGNNNTAIGYQTLAGSGFVGNNNIAIGHQSLNITTGNNNVGIGKDVQVPSAINDNQIQIGNTAIAYAGVQVGWSITSDRRWKSDVQNLELGLNFISKLRPVSYIRNDDFTQKVEYGFIAQELEQALNKFGAVNNGIITKADDGMLSVRYNDLLAPIVKAIQEQQEILDKLIPRIDKLESLKKN